VTNAVEDIPMIMEKAIEMVISQNRKVLLTYPNNDDGCNDIIRIIDNWKGSDDVIVRKNLGTKLYYAALNDCEFVIGNSSSGIIEAPYFNKTVINIGSRQEGRDKDIAVIDVKPDVEIVTKLIEEGYRKGWPNPKCNNLFGEGDTVSKIINHIKKYFNEKS